MCQPLNFSLLKTISILVIVAQIYVLSFSVNAEEERYEHFKGLPAETLDEALLNFKSYNSKLEAILAQPELSPKEMAEIHILSYTLENALQKMTQEAEKIAQALELVHLASETNEVQQVKEQGNYYLEQSGKLFGVE